MTQGYDPFVSNKYNWGQTPIVLFLVGNTGMRSFCVIGFYMYLWNRS